jgi:hypothetical protein
MERTTFDREMPAWLYERLRVLHSLARFHKREGERWDEEGDMSRAQDSYHDGFVLCMDIVALTREWMLPDADQSAFARS